MDEDIEKLEIKISYLENLASELNEVIIGQERIISEMQKAIERLEKKVSDLEELSGEARPNRRPPHY